MRLALQLLIITLPMVVYPRLLGSVKLSDFAFALVIFCEFASYRFKPTRLMILLIAFFAVFAAYGVYRIQNVEPVAVMGGWDIGLLSPGRYQVVAAAQTILYIIGSAILAKYLFVPRYNILRFQFRFFMFWSVVCLMIFFVENSFSLSKIFDPNANYLSGSFTEKGPMSVYVLLVYALFLAARGLPGAAEMKLGERALFVGIVLADILFCKADRGTILFIAINVLYLFSKRPALLLKALPTAIVVGILMIPLYGRLFNKLSFYTSVVRAEAKDGTVGRYAAVLLAPELLHDSPWFGIGYGNYIFYRTSSQYGSFLPIIAKDEPDNTLLQVAMECGGVGLLIFVALAIVWPGFIIQRAKTAMLWPPYLTYLIALTSGVTSYFAMWVWLFCLIEIARCWRLERIAVESRKPPPDPPVRLIAVEAKITVPATVG